MRSLGSVSPGASHSMKTAAVLLIAMVIVLGVSLVYFLRPHTTIGNEPVHVLDGSFGQYVCLYTVDVNGENVSVGELGFTWQLALVENDSEYDYYEFTLHESVRGSAADSGEVGWIEGGRTLVDLRTDRLLVEEACESHGTGAVEVAVSTDAEWNGSVELIFTVLTGSGSFRPREATNVIDLVVTIWALHGADLNFTISSFTDWSIYGYSFDRVLISGAETIVLDISSFL